MDVFDQLEGVAVVPLNFTVLVPCTVLNVVPVSVTDVPTGPDETERLISVGGVKLALTIGVPGGAGAWANATSALRSTSNAKAIRKRRPGIVRIRYPVSALTVAAKTAVTSAPISVPSEAAL